MGGNSRARTVRASRRRRARILVVRLQKRIQRKKGAAALFIVGRPEALRRATTPSARACVSFLSSIEHSAHLPFPLSSVRSFFGPFFLFFSRRVARTLRERECVTPVSHASRNTIAEKSVPRRRRRTTITREWRTRVRRHTQKGDANSGSRTRRRSLRQRACSRPCACARKPDFVVVVVGGARLASRPGALYGRQPRPGSVVGGRGLSGGALCATLSPLLLFPLRDSGTSNSGIDLRFILCSYLASRFHRLRCGHWIVFLRSH